MCAGVWGSKERLSRIGAVDEGRKTKDERQWTEKIGSEPVVILAVLNENHG